MENNEKYFSCLCKDCNLYKFGRCAIKIKKIKIQKIKKIRCDNQSEQLFNKAAMELTRIKIIDECLKNEYLDSIGIDFLLIKYVKYHEEDDSKRLTLPIQIKKSVQGANGHKHKYPYIPVMVIGENDEIKEIKKRILAVFLESFKESAYYRLLLIDFNGTINH